MITGITFWLIVIMANLVVGACVGLTGVAGFLLPIIYTSLLGLGTTRERLALSFGAFIVSGLLGSVNYKKTGNLDVRFGLKLSVGSLVGAVFGVCLNMLIPESAWLKNFAIYSSFSFWYLHSFKKR